MFPPPLHPESVAGDVFIEYSVPWYWPNARPYLGALLLHEVGHAMGMADSWDALDVMYPNNIVPGKPLSQKEWRVMRCLYQGVCW